MKKIDDLSELDVLTPGEKFYLVSHGKSKTYCYNGTNCKTKTPIAVHDAVHVELKTFTKHDLSKYSAILIGQYDSKMVGELMVEQMQLSIQSVKEIYIDGV